MIEHFLQIMGIIFVAIIASFIVAAIQNHFKRKEISIYAIVDKTSKLYYTDSSEESLKTNELMTKESLKHLDLKIVKLTGEI